jgi:AI-2 transport protein TqsA
VTRAPERGSYLYIMGMVAVTMVVLFGMRLAAPILSPVLFSVVLAIIFNPLYVWLRRRVPAILAILVVLVVLVLLFSTLGWIVTLSVTRLSARLAFYASQIDGRLELLDVVLARYAAGELSLASLYSTSAMIGAARWVLNGLSSFLGSAVLILLLVLFFLIEGPALIDRLRVSFGQDNPAVARLVAFGRSVCQQFALRAIVNLVVAVAFGLFLWLLGIDHALLWAVLTFFLGYIPYLGIIVASIPAVLLALAQFGFGTALVVVVGLTVINMSAENLLVPVLMGRGFSLSATAVFLAFYFWTWLLGTTGAFLSMPLLFLMVIVFDSFPETRWLSDLIVVRTPEPAPERVPEPAQNRA